RHAHAHHSGDRAGGRQANGRGRGRRAMTALLTRRSVPAGPGALVVSFACASRLLAQQPPGGGAGNLPGSLKKSPFLDAWVRIDADGGITVFTGKAELGQGIKTALLQVAAEQLDVPFASVKLV